MRLSIKRRGALATIAMLAPSVAVAGCGGQASTATRTPRTVATVAAKPTVAVAAANPSLHILTPAPGASTGETVNVRVRLTGASPHGAHPLRYVLDGVLTRDAATHLTLSELAPGRHRVVVELAGNPHVRATRSFTVTAPAAVAQPASSEPMGGGSQPAATAPKAATPPPARTNPERTSSEHTSPPPTPQPAEGSIPQGGGGDHDGDNSGGPSDGDGGV